jgi:hypothetical protein
MSEKTLQDMQADLDLLIKKYGKLEMTTNSLNKRVQELENDNHAILSVTDLSYLKDIVTKRAGEVSQQKYQINQQLDRSIIDEEYHKELMIDIKEEERKLDEMFGKLNYQISK